MEWSYPYGVHNKCVLTLCNYGVMDMVGNGMVIVLLMRNALSYSDDGDH